jgi:hypothetical protein
MGTTTNNGWPTPVATDLVKDGWEAIKDLGDAIDTTLGVYAPSTPGLTLINTTSFSGVSSQLLSLSGSYENYRIIISHTGTSVDSGAWLRLSLSGTPATGANYGYAFTGLNVSGVGNNQNGGSDNKFQYGTNETAASTEFAGFVFDLIDVNVARYTKITSSGISVGSAGAITAWTGAGLHDVSTAYNQVQFLPSTGTFSGRASVFGYNL